MLLVYELNVTCEIRVLSTSNKKKTIQYLGVSICGDGSVQSELNKMNRDGISGLQIT